MERIRQLPQNDWHDQDLLTKREAAERLDTEIQVVRDQLARTKVDSVEREQLAKRLSAMEAALGDNA